MKQLTRKQAIKFYKSEIWKDMTDDDLVKMQLFQKRLSMPFSIFHEAITRVLNRDVYTHEFADSKTLQLEYLGEKEPPTLEEIMDIIPKEKRIFIQIEKEEI